VGYSIRALAMSIVWHIPIGVVAVFRAGDPCQVLARNNLGEQIVATPALVDGQIYVRTEGHLYAFGEAN
jgi:hypothetical protein